MTRRLSPPSADPAIRYAHNLNDEVTAADTAIVLRMAARGEYSIDADVSGDGQVTSLDALMILQAAA